ncbi:unnamed protein product [Ectocarpus sp. 6 AP-2014]
MKPKRSTRVGSRRSAASNTRHLVSASSLGQQVEALRTRADNLSVEDLREIGRQIELALPGEADLREVGLHRTVRAVLLPLVAQPGFAKKRKGYRQHLVHALAEAASGPVPPSALLPILRAKETGPAATDLTLEILQRIIGKADEGGGGGSIRSNDTSKNAVIDLLHHVVAEVVTSGVTKGGRRGAKGPPAHLISFLVNAFSTLPEYALVFAKDLLVLTESSSNPARKMSLAILASILGHGRELGAQCGGTILDPALAAVLRMSRSDGDATVRSSAFDSVAKFLGEMETTLYRQRLDDDDDTSSDLDDGTPSGDVLAHQQSRSTAETLTDDDSTGSGGGGGRGVTHGARATETMEMEIAPREGGAADHAGDADACPLSEKRPSATASTSAACTQMGAMHGATSGRQSGEGDTPVTSRQHTTGRAHRATRGAGAASEENRGQRREAKVPAGPWAVGGALQSSLSAAAEALLTDGSKAVRAKALACSLRILKVHGGTIKPRGASCENTTGDKAGSAAGPGVSSRVERILSAASSRCALAALEALAGDNTGGSTIQAYLNSTGGGGRHRKAADTARALLVLPCVESSPVDLVMCYARCRVAPGVGEGEAVGATEAKRALREIAQATFCADIRKLLKAVSVIMAADERRQGLEDGSANINFADTTEGASFPLSEVLCEVLAGVDSGAIVSLLCDALKAYTAGDEIAPRDRDDAAATAPVLLRTLALLAEATGLAKNGVDEQNGARQPGGSSNRERLAGRSGQHGAGDEEEQLRTLAGSQGLFWRRLEQRMEDIERDERGEETGGRGVAGDRGQLRRRGLGVSVEQYHGGGGGGHGHRSAASDAVSELSELLRMFQLLATRSLLSPENSAALEALVFPAALSRRRLIRQAVGLALALEEPHRVLLSSLAILQDAAFSRTSTDVGSRACDYVRLIGVLARENASFIAAHIREEYSARCLSRRGEEESAENGEDDYMAGVSNREAMEREIRRLRESSVTSDGMLSCYTPFLLAIVRRRVADTAAARSVTAEKGAATSAEEGEEDDEEDELLENGSASAGGAADGDGGGARVGSGGDAQDETRYHVAQQDGGKVEATGFREDVGQDRGATAAAGGSLPASSCPRALCTEALWALSEYAVLSAGLAAAEVLPLAERLASDTLEHPQVRNAAVGVLTRKELATDEIAAHACSLLEDENPCLRREVLVRLGQLMKESRIKTAHLSRFALLLVDVSERVRQAAQKVFIDYLQPRPDTVCRCLFETYFTLDAEEAVKRKVLQRLVAVAREAAPGQGLESLGSALVRKVAEAGDSEAAFFLSLVPPTVNSFEAAEVAHRRGQLAQSPHGTISLVATHFSRGAQRGAGSSLATTASIAGRGGGAPLSKAQALEMAAQIGSLASRVASASRSSRRAKVAAATATGAAARNTTPAARPRRGKKTEQAAATQGGQGYDSGSDDDSLTSVVECKRGGRYTGLRGSDNGARKKGGDSRKGSKKRRRDRETSRTRAGGAGGGIAANAKANREKNDDRMDASVEDDGHEQGEEDEEEEEEDEEEQWQG